MDVTIRPVVEEELAAWCRCIADAQGRDHSEQVVARLRQNLGRVRPIGAFDRGVGVGGAAVAAREMTLPGGTRADVGALQLLGVAPTHRGRGVFTALMQHQLRDLYDYRREAVVVAKVQRRCGLADFGFGVATQALVMSGPLGRLRLRGEVAAPTGRTVLLEAHHARPIIEVVHAKARAMNVGWVEREPAHWQALFDDSSISAGQRTAARIAVHLDDDEVPTGYALFCYDVHHDEVGRDNTRLVVLEAVATRRHAYASLWRFLLSLEGAHEIMAEVALDEPVQQMIDNTAELRWQTADRLAVRLVDVARALSERRYSAPVDVVIEVIDRVCPWNEGRYRLQGDQSGADCARTTASADLTCSVADLAALHLGGTSMVSLALAGRVEMRSTAALQDCSVAFRGFREPGSLQSRHWPTY